MSESGPHIVDDPAALRDFLAESPITTAYMIGDLDEPYREQTTWYAVGRDGAVEAVMMLYNGLSAPVVITYGQSGAMGEALSTFHEQLPARSIAQLQPHHVAAMDGFFDTSGLMPKLRMALRPEEMQAVPASPWTIERLSHRDTGEIIELYQHYPDSFFEPTQLDSGHYYGIRVDGKLASVAGVHVVSATHGLAVLGNTVTAPDYRGRGLSTACTAHLCRRLFDEGIELLALNVGRENGSALRVYEKLGFRYHDTYLEGWLAKPATPDPETPEA